MHLHGEKSTLFARLKAVQLLAMDVDGVLTDGTLDYGGSQAVQKRFHVTDGLGLTVLAQAGLDVAWITGRADVVTERRAAELHIPHLLSGVRDKGSALRQLAETLEIFPEQIAYIGDDWNDLPAFAVTKVRIAVSTAVAEVRGRADFVTERGGGQGAVREVCEAILEAKGLSATALQSYLDSLHAP